MIRNIPAIIASEGAAAQRASFNGIVDLLQSAGPMSRQSASALAEQIVQMVLDDLERDIGESP